jgi:hypothetical protein
MTALIAWVGVDSRGPASIYLASDSRISWDKGEKWDHGRKLFASQTKPLMMGYYGQAFFPTQVLGQLIDLVDADILTMPDDSSRTRFDRLIPVVKSSFEEHPKKDLFVIIFCTREGERMDATFHINRLSWNKDTGWEVDLIEIPTQSCLVISLGSGADSVSNWSAKWNKSEAGGTSRAVFGAFCDSLSSGEDEGVGGPPQLVGLYRIGPAKHFGIIENKKRFVLGLPITTTGNLQSIEWRNSLFERCDPETMTPLEWAQRHARPKGWGPGPTKP